MNVTVNRLSLIYKNIPQCSKLILKNNGTYYLSLRNKSQLTCSVGAKCYPSQEELPCNSKLNWQRHKRYSTVPKKNQLNNETKQIVESKYNPYAGLSSGEKVKEASKDASYAIIIVIGVGVTGIMFYMIGRELFSSQSPSGIYSDAFDKCIDNDQLIGLLGEPIKGYGETNRRGRRRHVSHDVFESQGVQHLRMRFYVEGPRGKATVNLEMNKKNSSKYEYRYIMAETQSYPRRSVLVIDNT